MAVAAALGVRALLDPWLGDQRPLAMLYGAIAAAAWFGGLGPAVLACVGGYVVCDWAFIPPRGELGFSSGPEAFGALVYGISSSIIVAFSVAARANARRAVIAAEDRRRVEAASRQQVLELARNHALLERERERLAIALRTGGMGVYEWRPGETGIWWSPELYPLYGVDPGTFTPTVDAFTALIHPDDRPTLWQKTQACLESCTTFEHEYRVIHPDGTEHWILNRSEVGVGPDGRAERLTGIAMDVSARKDAEALLLAADRRKNEFIATLAHELRNPLAPVRYSLALLRTGGSRAADEARALGVIERQVGHMARLLDDLLDVSRLTRGTLEVRPERVTLASVIDAALEIGRPLLDRQGHAVTLQMPEETIWLLADPVRLTQVFGNLLNNAAKYTPSGGQVRIEAAASADGVSVRISDTGIGLEADVIPHLFQMFAQADGSTSRRDGGLGIGLALARGIVEAHGGRIRASSSGAGLGSCFDVCLPRAASHTAPLPPTRDVPRGPRLRILVADDLTDAADELGRMLEGEGHEVQVVYDGASAVAAALSSDFDVAILDIGMPRPDGLEAARRVRDDARCAGLRLIAVTGWGQAEDRRRTREAGFDVHLTKPIAPEQLLGELRGGGDAGSPKPLRAAIGS